MIVETCNMLVARRQVAHLWETKDETVIWSNLAKACAERGHEMCQKAFDKDFMGEDMAYWDSMEEFFDQLTPAAVALLNYLSEDHYKEEDYIHKNGSMCTVYVQPGTEHFLEYLAKTVKAFGNHQYTKNLLNCCSSNSVRVELPQ